MLVTISITRDRRTRRPSAAGGGLVPALSMADLVR
jgi:hypothetical protein